MTKINLSANLKPLKYADLRNVNFHTCSCGEQTIICHHAANPNKVIKVDARHVDGNYNLHTCKTEALINEQDFTNILGSDA